jgi:hypothetical protein
MKVIGIIFVVVFGSSSMFLMYRLHKRADVDIFPRFYVTRKSFNKLNKDILTKLDNFEKIIATCIVVSFILAVVFMALGF